MEQPCIFSFQNIIKQNIQTMFSVQTIHLRRINIWFTINKNTIYEGLTISMFVQGV
ncbi:hypothetical protein HMPREF1199_01335 [Hoylesella oralis CC98A]|nr:hypothetical protein HMPREF1199_01335 [Hoylesella oralis CC98A]